MSPALVNGESSFLCEAFTTLSAEKCGHLFVNICYLVVRVLGLIDFHYTFHQLVTDIEKEMTTSLCSECGKSFTEEATLSIHQSRAHDKTSYSCDECDTDVIGRVASNNHKRRHKTPVVRNLQKKNKCDICPYESADKSHVNRHKEAGPRTKA